MDYKQITQELREYFIEIEGVKVYPKCCSWGAYAIQDLLKERDAAIAELNRIAEFCEYEFLGYLNNTIHRECGYEYYSQLFDLLCQVTDWEHDEIWKHRVED